jgi:DNA polymerase-3 subunit delta'
MAQTAPTTILTPAQLFIGPEDILIEKVERYLQKTFCPHNSCSVCHVCEQIRKHQLHAALWLTPEKYYTVDDIETILKTTALSLDEDEQFFFILEKADLLTAASANKLLKVLEEPPIGYHFILCAEQGDALLPTIKSRCVITSFFLEGHQQLPKELLKTFTTASLQPYDFLRALEASKINEIESAQLLDQLISYWAKKYKQALQEDDGEQQDLAEKKVTIFSNALLKLPMPGSSKIFWRDLFLENDLT